MAFIDTVDLYIPHQATIAECRQAIKTAGMVVFGSEQRNCCYVQPRTIRSRYDWTEPTEQNPQTGLAYDAPLIGDYAGRSLGWLTFRPNVCFVRTTLGHFWWGHNHYLECAEASTHHIRHYLRALYQSFPFLDLAATKLNSLDVTYQVKAPGYTAVAPQLFALLCERTRSDSDVRMHRNLNLSGTQRRTRQWSLYDKFKHIRDRYDIEVWELEDVCRVTERISRGDRDYGALFTDPRNLEFSQEGLLGVLHRWDDIAVTIPNLIDCTMKLCGQDPQHYTDYLAALAILRDPALLEQIGQTIQAVQGRKMWMQAFRRKVGAALQRMQEADPQTFQISIPSLTEFEAKFSQPSWYLGCPVGHV